MKTGDRFKTTAVIHRDERNEFFDKFGVHPEHRMMWGVRKDEQIYEVEFEITEVNPPYPDDAYAVGYYGYLMEGHDKVSLIQANVILFTIQFPSPVFNYDEKHLKMGTIYKLKVKGFKKIRQYGQQQGKQGKGHNGGVQGSHRRVCVKA